MTATLLNPLKTRRKVSREELQKIKEKDRQLVKGVFRCYEPIGGTMKFSFKKYKEDPVLTLTMRDGETYEVPRMVAKHLNTCAYPIHSHLQDQNGNPMVGVGKTIKRCSFESLEFLVDEL